MKYTKVEKLNWESNDDSTQQQQQQQQQASSSNTIHMHNNNDDDHNVNSIYPKHDHAKYDAIKNVQQQQHHHHHPDATYGIPTTNYDMIPVVTTTTTTTRRSNDGITHHHNYHDSQYDPTNPNSLHDHTTESSTFHYDNFHLNNTSSNNYYYTSWMSTIILGIGVWLYIKRKNDHPSSTSSSSSSYPTEAPRMNNNNNNNNHHYNNDNNNDDDFYYHQDNNNNDNNMNDTSSTIIMIKSYIQSSLIYTWMEQIYDEIIYNFSYCYIQYQIITEYISRYMIYIRSNIHWISQYIHTLTNTITTTTTNHIIRQQRMDYYYNTNGNQSSSSSNNNSTNNEMYYHPATLLRSSHLPDLVEGIRDIDDDCNHTSAFNSATVPMHTTEPFTITNIDNHVDNGHTKSKDTVINIVNEPSPVVENKSNHIPSWNNHHSSDLEPAFVNEMDYPSNWMVYHPILQRVLLKVQADAYNQKMMMMHTEESQFSTIHHDETMTRTTTTTTTNQPIVRQSVMAT